MAACSAAASFASLAATNALAAELSSVCDPKAALAMLLPMVVPMLAPSQSPQLSNVHAPSLLWLALLSVRLHAQVLRKCCVAAPSRGAGAAVEWPDAAPKRPATATGTLPTACAAALMLLMDEACDPASLLLACDCWWAAGPWVAGPATDGWSAEAEAVLPPDAHRSKACMPCGQAPSAAAAGTDPWAA